jgi:hypothetical protein
MKTIGFDGNEIELSKIQDLTMEIEPYYEPDKVIFSKKEKQGCYSTEYSKKMDIIYKYSLILEQDNEYSYEDFNTMEEMIERYESIGKKYKEHQESLDYKN